MGYEVVAVNVEPEEYLKIAESCGVKVCKGDLERDTICLGTAKPTAPYSAR